MSGAQPDLSIGIPLRGIPIAVLIVLVWMLLCKQCYHGCCCGNSVSVDVAVKTVSVDVAV